MKRPVQDKALRPVADKLDRDTADGQPCPDGLAIENPEVIGRFGRTKRVGIVTRAGVK